MKFKEFFNKIFLIEALKPKFNIEIDGSEVELTRDYHVRDRRGNSKMPRDAGMSKNKYQKVLSAGLEHIDPSSKFTITWTSNNKNNAISGFYKNGDIVIFGAIMKSDKKPETLYRKKGINRYHIGNINFS